MINDRIDTLINRLCDGNKSLFAKNIGVTPSVIGNITGERKGNPSFDVIKKILNAFVCIDARWLITGDGEMLKDTTSEHPVITEVVYKSDPRDMELISSKNEIIETQRELISTLKQRINDLECNPSQKVDAFTPVRSAASTGRTSQSKTTK